jgi:hypothetical protein
VIVAVCLLAYAFLLLTIGASGLVRAGWADRAPRLAIAAWLALTSSAIGSVILGGLALGVPTAGVSYHLADLLAACAHDVRARYGHPGGAALAAAGVALTFVVATRVGWCTVRMLVTARRDGQRHCQQLQAVGRADRRPSKPWTTRSSLRSLRTSGLTSEVTITCWCWWPGPWLRHFPVFRRSGTVTSGSRIWSNCWPMMRPPRQPPG